MTRFLVTGASGLLGVNFSLRVASLHNVIGVTYRQDLHNPPFATLKANLAEKGAAEALIQQARPDVVLHCAALANVDQCEDEPELASRVNSELPGEIAEACKNRGIKLVHISTDAVFDGQTGNYSESDPTNPVNVYAKTKLAGEEAVAQADPEAIIARVNFYGWSPKGNRSLAEIFYYNLSSNIPMRGFTDVFFCPFHVDQLTDVILRMLKKNLKGLYHVTSPESLSKYQFGRMIADQFGIEDAPLTPSSWQEAGLKASRSPNLVLNSDKLGRDLEIKLPGQLDGLHLFYLQFLAGLPQRLREMTSPA